MKNKYIIMILATLLLLPLVSASDDIYRIQGVENNITAFCSEPYDICDDQTSCNISISNEQGNNIVNQQNMNRLGNNFYYQTTFNSAGNYKANYICRSGDNYGSDINNIKVLGENYTFTDSSLLNMYVLIIMGSISLALFGLFLINKNIVIGFTSATILLIVGLFIWIQGIVIQINDYATVLYYQVPSLISWGLGFVLVVFSLWLYWYSASYSDKEDSMLEYEYREEE